MEQVFDNDGNPVVDSPEEADQNASEKLNTEEANNVGDENRDGTQDDDDDNGVVSENGEIIHIDDVSPTPDVSGETIKDVINRADYVELAKNQYMLTQEEAETMFERTSGETFDDDVAKDIKANRKVNVLKTVRVPAGEANPLTAAEAEREE